MRARACALLVVMLAGDPAAAQTAAPTVQPKGSSAALPTAGKPGMPAPVTASAGNPQSAAEPYTYKPEGRRDPFLNLLGVTLEPRAAGKRADGLGGLLISEIAVRGIIESRDGYVAMIQGPEGKTYTVRANDRLLDGVVKSITPQAVVLMQDVNDPLSLVKQREVRKGLRTPDNKP